MNQSNNYTKYIILGAGPAGLQMAYFLQQQNRDYLILERNETAGSFFATNPVHRKLLSINKKHNYFTEAEFNWRHDWNSLLSGDPDMRLTNYTDDLYPHADVLYQYLQDFARHFELHISYNTLITRVEKDADGLFVLNTKDFERFRCKVLLLGLGNESPYLPPEIEGIELATRYDEQSLDLNVYRNKRVGIIGGGNSAFETAEYLSGEACFVHVLTDVPVKFAWDTHYPGDLRAVNNGVYDLYQLKSLHAVLNPTVKKIKKLSDGTLQTSHEYDYPDATPPGTLKLTREYDHIICCTGYNLVNGSMFADNCKPESVNGNKAPVLNSSWESNNVSDMYFIGAAMSANDVKAASSFIHGYRYNIRTLSHLLEEKYEDAPFPSEHIESFDLDNFLEWMYERFSTSAALFQLFGFLCDVLIYPEGSNSPTLYKELPLDYVKKNMLNEDPAFVFTLEFGFDKFEEPSITFMGPSDPVDSSCTAFLHPVIRYFKSGECEEFHFGDSLLARWDRPHGKGGAVLSNHYAFLKWLEARLNADFNLPEPLAGGAYHPWTQEEIEKWATKNKAADMSFDCKRPF